jgi:sec-independent protein translocase protein TatC
MSTPEDPKSPTASPGEENHNGTSAPTYVPVVTDEHGQYDDTYSYRSQPTPVLSQQAGSAAPPADAGGGRRFLPPMAGNSDDGDDDDDGMLRMSFIEHLEELRSRLFYCVIGLIAAFVVSLTFCDQLWSVVSYPAISALLSLGYPPSEAMLTQLTPMETFTTVWVKMPLLTSIFLASPWILYQIWGFISPGLYKRERRWATPFILISAGLFISGGVFAYFVAFKYGLTFLLGLGRGYHIRPLVSVTEYFDLFVNVILGVALVFELPIVIFFLTLLRIASPRFLLSNSRYAILIITVVAAVITPTPDVVNLMLFAVPMYLLFYVGIFSGYLLTLTRETGKFPWRLVALVVIIPLILTAAGVSVAIARYGYHFVQHWPFLMK